jgi:hypothetical protein
MSFASPPRDTGWSTRTPTARRRAPSVESLEVRDCPAAAVTNPFVTLANDVQTLGKSFDTANKDVLPGAHVSAATLAQDVATLEANLATVANDIQAITHAAPAPVAANVANVDRTIGYFYTQVAKGNVSAAAAGAQAEERAVGYLFQALMTTSVTRGYIPTIKQTDLPAFLGALDTFDTALIQGDTADLPADNDNVSTTFITLVAHTVGQPPLTT